MQAIFYSLIKNIIRMRKLTHKKLNNYLSKFNVSYDTLETIRKLTGPFRHEVRVNEVLEAVNNYYENNNLESLNSNIFEINGDQVNKVINPFFKEGLIKALICYFDYCGLYGGGLREPGSGTTRLLKVGKGRRYASDGPVYLSATLSAVERLLRIYFGIKYRDVTILFKDQVLVGFKNWFIPVKDFMQLLPPETHNTLIHQLIKLIYNRFNEEQLSETDLLNSLAELALLLDEINQPTQLPVK